MPEFFHVDRSGSLQVGQVIDLDPSPTGPPLTREQEVELGRLFPQGIARHAQEWLANFGADGSLVQRELLYEFVRRADYPDRPSRFESVFGFATEEDARAFLNVYVGGQPPIVRLEADEHFRANMLLLDITRPGAGISLSAQRYWSGARGPVGELWEELLVPPATVVGLI